MKTVEELKQEVLDAFNMDLETARIKYKDYWYKWSVIRHAEGEFYEGVVITKELGDATVVCTDGVTRVVG